MIVFMRHLFFTATIAALVAACGGIEPKKDHSVLVEEIKDELEQSGEGDIDPNALNKNAVSVREAYLNIVYPLLTENCSRCHIHQKGGAHGFTSDDLEEAVGVAGRLIGTNLDDSRFYLKVSNEQVPHPDKPSADDVLPDLKSALESFFDAIEGSLNGIFTPALKLTDAETTHPQINPSGYFIFEGEGFDVPGNKKFKVTNAVRSNGKYVNSTTVPAHPLSGQARTYGVTYSGATCSDYEVTITQPAHIGANGVGPGKFFYPIDAQVTTDDGNLLGLRRANDNVTIDNIIRVLPYNKLRATVNDSDYQNAYDNNWRPDFSAGMPGTYSANGTWNPPTISGNLGSTFTATVGNISFNEDQILHFIAQLRHQRNRVSNNNRVIFYDEFLHGDRDGAGPNAGAIADVDPNNYLVNKDTSVGNAYRATLANVFKYLRLTADTPTAGQQSFRLSHWDPFRGRRLYRDSMRPVYGEARNTLSTQCGNAEGCFLNYTYGTMHQNMSLNTGDDLAVIQNLYEPVDYVPGTMSYTLKVPENLSFLDIEDPTIMPFRQYYRADGNFRVRIKKLSDDSWIPVQGNNRCASFSGGEAWRHNDDVINLERGETYTIEILQSSEDTAIDVFMLVADTELNEHLVADPNINTEVLRQKFYGAKGTGVQAMTTYLRWDVGFGMLQMEVEERPGYYAIENPIVFTDGQYAGQNVSVKGFNFIVNSNVALTDSVYQVDAIRPNGQNIVYGQAILPKQNGFNKDEIAVIFARLEATTADGELPKYDDIPPLESARCEEPEIFRQWMWPAYTQQHIMIRDDYMTWKNGPYPAEYIPGDDDNDPDVEFADTPTTYVCADCHNEDHPFFQINRQDYLITCDLILARTNLQRPELSFSLRGLRGQFNHIPMWTMYDPWNGNNLRKRTLNSGVEMLHGPMNGAFASYSFSLINSLASGLSGAQQDGMYRNLNRPARIGFNEDPEYGIPVYNTTTQQFSPFDINPDSAIYNNGSLSTLKRLGTDNMQSQHDAVIDKWVDRAFMEWVNAERRARGLREL